MSHTVLIGAGQAAASCVARLRAKGYDGAITLIGAEPVAPYQRPPLSKAYLLGDMDLDRLLLRGADWWSDQNVALRTGTRATGIDPAAKEVELEAGERLAYDRLVLCTGAHPRQLPAAIGGDLDGVFYVRDLADADAMEPALRQGHVLVVGGGYIGLEAAAVARKRGMDVTLIEAADRILGRVACAQTADVIRDLHQSHGVVIREGVGLDRLTGDGTVSGAVLADGTTLTVDAVIVGIGVNPATILADAAGLTVDNGISVDAHGVTSDPAILAAGDCASFPGPDGPLRLESVGNAIDMGELCADTILGAPRAYRPKPWFWSDQYDCKLQIAGLGAGHDAIFVRPGDAGAVSHWYYAGDRLLAVDAINDPRAYMVGKRLIDGGKSPAPAEVVDPSVPLKQLL